MPGWNHDGAFKLKPCGVCGQEFKPNSGHHRFCSDTCKGKWKYISGAETTETQYAKISGNWSRYFSRLVAPKHRSNLTKDVLINQYNKQNGKCALTGVELTCTLEKGKRFWTNASIDRIDAGKDYSENNIQLVCYAVNSFRNNMSVSEYVDWCRKVAANATQLPERV